ncbi:MAG TPA: hypothetical protein VLA19_29225 [Herpetosiphonaceae bacterium]|nr:hypothetical protein [Herpetosiphonaceae bacterium]
MPEGDSWFTADITTFPKGRGNFHLPERECRRIGVGDRDVVRLVIQTPEGVELFRGEAKLGSGTEVYGQDVIAGLEANQPIKVTVSRMS